MNVIKKIKILHKNVKKFKYFNKRLEKWKKILKIFKTKMMNL